LILLPLAIPLTKLASLTMKHIPGDTMPSLPTIQLNLNAMPVMLVIYIKKAWGNKRRDFFLSSLQNSGGWIKSVRPKSQPEQMLLALSATIIFTV
jgi:hypothetical protein